jgi:hypothetical protein
MSLGDTTNCDLSAGIAKVDKEQLIKSLEYQYHHLLNCLHNECTKHKNSYPTDNTHTISWFVSVGGRSMNNTIQQIRKTAELLYTLKESKNAHVAFTD